MSSSVQAMCTAGSELEDLGMSPGASGNISVRHGNTVYISPSGVPLGALTPPSLSELAMDHCTGQQSVRGAAPSKESVIHEMFYRTNQMFECVIHLHSTNAVALACLPPWSEFSAVPPITPYLVMRVGHVPLVRYAPPGDSAQARSLVDMGFEFNGVLLQNHGPVVAGRTVAEAMSRAVEVEETAKIVLSLRGWDDVNVLEPSEAAALAVTYGQPWGETSGALPHGEASQTK